MKIFKKSLSILILAMSLHAAASEITLVTPEKSVPAIVLSAQAEDQERYAAEDLKHYLGKMTGREFVISDKADGFAIHIGKVSGNEDLQKEAEALGRDGFILDVSPEAIRIAGGSKFGTAYGVYELLERLGVRWFFPGEWGEVVPQKKELSLPVMRFADKPAFSIRQMHSAKVDENVGDWYRRNRHNRCGFYGHSHLIPPKKYAKNHPEWYAEIDGVRQVDDPNYKLCHSNEKMVAQAIEDVLEDIRQRKADTSVRIHDGYKHLAEDYSVISISPTDGGGFCRCSECLALGSVSDRLRGFANKIAAKVREEFPDYSVGYYEAYSEHQAPPSIKAQPGVVVFPTTWTKSFFKPITDISNKAFREKTEAFLASAPRMALRDYDGLSVWWGFGPLTLADVHAKDYQWYQQHGIEGIITEAGSGWGPWGYSYYLMSKLWWNPNADLDALKEDFVTAAYGEAAEPMRVYYKLLDESVIHPSPKNLYTMRQKLEEAAKLAVDPGVKKRINSLRAHFYLSDIYDKHQARESKPEDISNFYKVLASLDPSVSPFSRSRRYLKTFPANEGNTQPLSEQELEALLAKVELPPPGKEYTAWLDQDDLRLQPAQKNVEIDFPESLGISLRFGPATLLIYAKAGERIKVRQTAEKWDTFATAYELQNPELVSIAEGIAEGETIVDVAAPSDGIYTLVLSPGGRYPEIHVSNRWAVIKGSASNQSFHPMGRVREAYIYVPSGTREFAIVSRAYEPLTIQVDGPVERLSARTPIKQTAQTFQQHNIPVADGEDGKIWRISFVGSKKDIYFQGIPPFLASHPARLLLPENPNKSDHVPSPD